MIHPPSKRVKDDPESKMVHDIYKELGYSAKRGVICIEVNREAPPPQPITKEKCESHIVSLIFAEMYNLRNGTGLFDEGGYEAVLTDMSQIDGFKTYKPLHKHELSNQD